MGLRGPLRDPTSRRGRAEARRAQAQESELVVAAAGDPEYPAWATERQRELFTGIVRDLHAAKVPIKHIDGHAIMMAVECLDSVQQAEELMSDQDLEPESRLAALKCKMQAGRDLMQWLEKICATPGSRARIGVKAEPEKKGGVLAELLAKRNG